MNSCIYCGAPLDDDALFCSNCGKKIEPQGFSCPRCGAELKLGSMFCANCGMRLGGWNDSPMTPFQEKQQVYVRKEEEDRNWWYVSGALFTAVLLVLGFWGWQSGIFVGSHKQDVKLLNGGNTAIAEEEDNDNSVTTRLECDANGVSFAMIGVQGGKFRMGCSKSEDPNADSDESPTHSVSLDSYYIGETEVTQELWEAVMDYNPSEFQYDSQLPVEFVSWDECEEFIQRLNIITQKKFRFPTEAEWEYAARGGHKAISSTYAGSNNISAVGWFSANSNGITHPVKSKSTNTLGLYDMSGNLWEWCQDWQGPYSSEAAHNPQGPYSGSCKILRGGAWNGGPKNCRLSNRDGRTTDYASNRLGLRLALYD